MKQMYIIPHHYILDIIYILKSRPPPQALNPENTPEYGRGGPEGAVDWLPPPLTCPEKRLKTAYFYLRQKLFYYLFLSLQILICFSQLLISKRAGSALAIGA